MTQTHYQMTRNLWTAEEDALLIAGMKQHGVSWKLIKKDYPELDKRHPSPCALKDRARVLGSKHRQEQADSSSSSGSRDHEQGVKERESPDVDDALTFRCPCETVHTWRKLIQVGLRCSCDRSLLDMLILVTRRFPWACYIALDCFDNEMGLLAPVRYVGQFRRKAENLDALRVATFDDIRVSLNLPRSLLMRILSPGGITITTNMRSGKDYMRIRDVTSGRWKVVNVEGTGGSLGYDREFQTAGSRWCSAPKSINDVMGKTAAGLLFTSAPPRANDVDKGGFCFLKDASNGCKCKMPCSIRKIINHLKGRDLASGIPVHLRRDNYKAYRDLIRYHGPEVKKPVWCEEFTTMVLHRKDVTERTLDAHVAAVERLWKRGTMALFASPWKVLDALGRSCATIGTQVSYLSLMSSILSHITNRELQALFTPFHLGLRGEYHQVLTGLCETQAVDSQMRSTREVNNWATIDELRKGISAMAAAAKTLLEKQRVLFYRLMLDQRTVRNDYRTLKIFKYDRNVDNYIDLAQRIIVFNSYKTSRTRGTVVDSIKPDLLQDITELFMERCALGHEYLFAKTDGGMFSSAAFSNSMITGLKPFIQGKHIGCCMIRHFVVTEALGGEKPLTEKRKLADSMMHSVNMQAKYLRIDATDKNRQLS